jgi:hypothetical protein
MDKLPNINLSPHLVQRPVALIALGIVALIVLAGLWLVLPPVLVIVLMIVVVALVAAGVYLRIKFPQSGMEDQHLLAYTRDQFDNFRSDATQHPESERGGSSDLDALRVEEYDRNRGLFLVHSWRKPSKDEGQIADIIIRLQEHRDTSTRPSVLKEGKVESVRYELGLRFFEEPVLKRDHRDDFALEVSAYRPMLCVAEVRFNDGHDPDRLSRYIDFPT